jgi:hypothetical protein
VKIDHLLSLSVMSYNVANDQVPLADRTQSPLLDRTLPPLPDSTSPVSATRQDPAAIAMNHSLRGVLDMQMLLAR